MITSVTRDDLSDGGAFVFAETIRSIRRLAPEASIEVLVPDFQGSLSALETVMNAEPDVIGHNLEMVPRLYPALRPGASYTMSLRVVESISARAANVISKSGIMVGLGETDLRIENVNHRFGHSGLQGADYWTISSADPETSSCPAICASCRIRMATSICDLRWDKPCRGRPAGQKFL